MDLCGVKETAEYSPRWSSGVLFRPQGKYWRISNTWYDFEKFAVKHPGGKHILYISRDRFDDATYAFEAHHMDFERNRDIIKKYRVSDELQDALNMHSKQGPSFSEGNSFYNDLRRRVTLHFKTNKMSTGPTMECLIIFVAVFAAWILSVCNTILNPCIFSACVQGIISALLGSFGHNWIHQPKYKWLAYLSLDTIGLSSDQWYREHVLQHHMYTNTPLDNHFNGTDPFLVANPTVNRSFIQSYILPYLNPIVLFFGIIGNYTTHGIAMWNGEEEFSISKLFFPALFAIYYYYLSSYGLFLFVFQCGVSGVYYFTIALMNHNSYNNHSVKLKNRARDWVCRKYI